MKAYQVHVAALALGLLIGSMGTSSAQVAGHAAGPGPENGAVIGPEGAGPESGPIEDEGPIPEPGDPGSAMRMGPEEGDNQGPPPMREDEEH